MRKGAVNYDEPCWHDIYSLHFKLDELINSRHTILSIYLLGFGSYEWKFRLPPFCHIYHCDSSSSLNTVKKNNHIGVFQIIVFWSFFWVTEWHAQIYTILVMIFINSEVCQKIESFYKILMPWGIIWYVKKKLNHPF